MSYTRLLYHIVFRTKYGLPTIVEEHEEILYRYIWGYVKEQGVVLYRINGMPDHLHLFVELKATINVADFVKHLKIVPIYF
ncbi:transposase IS200 like family protein [Glaesserella parasuis 174]|nr:transposase IS200 like family protein [Glaesserella parasuis MN-H]EQA12421.1 transposase IS200 like family protein [Glaesserella parasuis 174]STO79702.1 transposase IS200-like protein [Glaesserella parasuis]